MLTGKNIDPDRRSLAGGTLPICFVVVASLFCLSRPGYYSAPPPTDGSGLHLTRHDFFKENNKVLIFST